MLASPTTIPTICTRATGPSSASTTTFPPRTSCTAGGRPDSPRMYWPGTFRGWNGRGRDYHVPAEGHFYSVPYQLVGQEVDIRVTTATVEIFHDGLRVA